jgi:hypothetical protein
MSLAYQHVELRRPRFLGVLTEVLSGNLEGFVLMRAMPCENVLDHTAMPDGALGLSRGTLCTESFVKNSPRQSPKTGQ